MLISKKILKDDAELFKIVKEKLSVSLVGDILDKMGLRHQFLSPYLKPIQKKFIILGRAMPVLESDFFVDTVTGHNPISSQPFGLMFDALDGNPPIFKTDRK